MIYSRGTRHSPESLGDISYIVSLFYESSSANKETFYKTAYEISQNIKMPQLALWMLWFGCSVSGKRQACAVTPPPKKKKKKKKKKEKKMIIKTLKNKDTLVMETLWLT